MEISFTVDAKELNRAIGVVSVVVPQTQSGGAGGFLFVVRNDRCVIYSRDNNKHEARSSFAISEVSGEGNFILPTENIKALEYLKGGVTFFVTEQDGVHKVRYRHGVSGSSERVSLDPRSMLSFEKDIQTAVDTVTPREYPIKVLQFALGTSKSFLPKPTEQLEQDHFRTIKIFGSSEEDPTLAKANGYMVTANGREVCYFQCNAFLNNDLLVPQQHLSLIESFLSQSSGRVKAYILSNKSYLINEDGDVLGWPKHDSEMKKFAYYAKTEEIAVMVERDAMLSQLKYMRADLQKDRTKIKLHYDPSTDNFWFSSVNDTSNNTSVPVPSTKIAVQVEQPIIVPVNVEQMIHMFTGLRGYSAEFRIKILAGTDTRPKDRYMLRTIDGFNISDDGTVSGLLDEPNPDLYECRVTRFAPSIE